MSIRSKLFYLYISVSLLYAASFLIPRAIGNVDHYDLSPTQYRLLSLTVFVPTVAIWYIAFYGYEKLRQYASLIRNTPDGRHVSRVSLGLFFLVLALPTSALIGSGTNIVAQHYESLATASSIFRTYSNLLLPLIGFIIMSQGARGLSELSKQRPTYRAVNIMAAIFITIGIVYCSVIVGSHNLEVMYSMPQWLVLMTVVGPYLYMWYLGMLAAYEIHLYSRKAPGLIYRKTWDVLAFGLAAIIVMQIARQYISIVTSQLTELRLARLLILVYVFLVALSVGYILVAIGAKKLRKIEEV